MSRPDEPILCVIHHILNRNVHMNRWSLQQSRAEYYGFRILSKLMVPLY
jgi:hypothetical protein